MDKISSLKKLKGLLEEGIITEDEFIRQKYLVLGGPPQQDTSVIPSPEPTDNLSMMEPEESPIESSPIAETPTPTIIPSIEIVEDSEEQVIDWIEGGHGTPPTPSSATVEESDVKKDKEAHPKTFLWLGIVACCVGILIGVAYLLKDNIVDRVAKYEKAGFAILQFEKAGPTPHIIVMDKKGLYYDNNFSVTQILPVGKELDTREIHLHYDANKGLKATADEAEQKFAVTSSRSLFVKRITDNTYLLSAKQLTENPLTAYNLSLDPCYLVVKKDKSKDVTVIKVPKSKTEGSGYLRWKLSRNILEQYDSYFKSAFSKDEYKKIIERKYGHYLASIVLSLKSGMVQIEDPIEFDKLGVSYPANDVGTIDHCSSMLGTIYGIFRRELEESFYTNATQQTGISNRDYMKITDDDKYTFVINPNYGSGSQPKGLLRVNNKTKAVTLIDTGKEIEFLSNSICVTKIESFLIFFDSEKRVFYDYAGNRKN